MRPQTGGYIASFTVTATADERSTLRVLFNRDATQSLDRIRCGCGRCGWLVSSFDHNCGLYFMSRNSVGWVHMAAKTLLWTFLGYVFRAFVRKSSSL